MKRQLGQRVDAVGGRTPQGVRGLKLLRKFRPLAARCRTPQGVRGLKLAKSQNICYEGLSHSARSAWIETAPAAPVSAGPPVALRKECVD